MYTDPLLRLIAYICDVWLVIFSVLSISESKSELLLSSLSEGELYCAPVS